MRNEGRRLPVAPPKCARAHHTGTGRETMRRPPRSSSPRPVGPPGGRRISPFVPQKRSAVCNPQGAGMSFSKFAPMGTDLPARASTGTPHRGTSEKSLADVSSLFLILTCQTCRKSLQDYGIVSPQQMSATRKSCSPSRCSGFAPSLQGTPPTTRNAGKRADGSADRRTRSRKFGKQQMKKMGADL